MSIFQTTNVPCPSCGTKVDFRAVHSVNVDRSPHLREQILAGTFQQEACKNCGKGFRLDPQFNYMDLTRKEWIAVYPAADVERWREMEDEIRETFEVAHGSKAPEPARALAEGITPRLVFGWPACGRRCPRASTGWTRRSSSCSSSACCAAWRRTPSRWTPSCASSR